MVLLLPLWLVDIGLYEKVNVIFLIAGHTKNIADRLFKELKKDCHESDIFSMNNMIDLMNNSDSVKCFHVTHENFEKWDEILDKFYKRLVTDTTDKNHVFTYRRKDLGALFTERVINSVKKRQFLIKSRTKKWTHEKHQARIAAIVSVERNFITKVGLKDIKAVMLYKKYYPLIPFEFKEESLKISPPPPLTIMDKVREEKNKKARDKIKIKKMLKDAENVDLVPLGGSVRINYA